ncbi:hypothetical protein [Lysobacter arvi]|uniref:Transmembrane protein n=1 Tax=Lysobacter arvi TaxID=3038776 RepID=A0ABU1CGS1_9GAMM|nr:hypothetical protein [Lysobacter arvi]MDR0184156.1 hypothetical protein [Lysobacter arvi]
MQTRPDIHSGLDTLMRHAVAIGVAIVALLPAARGFSPTFGWMPLWLIAMPLCAWWALHRFRVPARETEAAVPVRARRRAGAQARRRRVSMARGRHSQAA